MEDGGFGLNKGGSDLDITSMAIQALAPYIDKKDVYTNAAGKSVDFTCFYKQTCSSCNLIKATLAITLIKNVTKLIGTRPKSTQQCVENYLGGHLAAIFNS